MYSIHAGSRGALPRPVANATGRSYDLAPKPMPAIPRGKGRARCAPDGSPQSLIATTNRYRPPGGDRLLTAVFFKSPARTSGIRRHYAHQMIVPILATGFGMSSTNSMLNSAFWCAFQVGPTKRCCPRQLGIPEEGLEIGAAMFYSAHVMHMNISE